MNTFTVTLPPDLARFIADELADGSWPSADALFAHAVTLARTAAVLGHSPVAHAPSPVASPPAADLPALRPNLRQTPPSGTVPVVDLTRQGFDSSSFMGELTRKLHADKK